MRLNKDDETVIVQYIRDAQGGYDGPVFINMQRLAELHMVMSKLISQVAIDKARANSRRPA